MATRKSRFILWIAFSAALSILPSQNSFARRGTDRIKYPFGLYLSANGDPAPGIIGLNLSATCFGFLRFNVGAGSYGDTLAGNLPIGLYNYTVRPILYAFAFLGSFFATNGSTKLDYDSFLNIPYAESHSSAFVYGGGVKMLVPEWKLSPALGLNTSQWQGSGNPWGSGNSGTIIYGSLGLDYQDGPTYAALGYNFCPSTVGSCGIFLNFGRFF